jgi:lysophospholipase L1-like esterase
MAAQTAPSATSAKDLSNGGTVLILGDSILDLHRGEKRVEAIMKRLLDQRAPQAQWTIYNEARGGQYIGPTVGAPFGTGPLLDTETAGKYFDIAQRHPNVDAVIVEYGHNDGWVYSPAHFRERLEALTGLLRRDYPGAVLIFCTTMHIDPKHSTPVSMRELKVPGFQTGRPKNDYLQAYNKEIREFAAAHRYELADIYQRLEEETVRGNWDLRMRNNGDPKDDAQHESDMAWFTNSHPNDRGTEVIAGLLVEALTKSR